MTFRLLALDTRVSGPRGAADTFAPDLVVAADSSGGDRTIQEARDDTNAVAGIIGLIASPSPANEVSPARVGGGGHFPIPGRHGWIGIARPVRSQGLPAEAADYIQSNFGL